MLPSPSSTASVPISLGATFSPWPEALLTRLHLLAIEVYPRIWPDSPWATPFRVSLKLAQFSVRLYGVLNDCSQQTNQPIGHRSLFPIITASVDAFYLWESSSKNPHIVHLPQPKMAIVKCPQCAAPMARLGAGASSLRRKRSPSWERKKMKKNSPATAASAAAARRLPQRPNEFARACFRCHHVLPLPQLVSPFGVFPTGSAASSPFILSSKKGEQPGGSRGERKAGRRVPPMCRPPGMAQISGNARSLTLLFFGLVPLVLQILHDLRTTF